MSQVQSVDASRKKRINWNISISIATIVTLIGCAIVAFPRIIANVEAAKATGLHSTAATSNTDYLFAFVAGMITFGVLVTVARK